MPALAIADGLVANGHRADAILYVGAQRGVETACCCPRTPYPHTFLDVVGLQRRLTAATWRFRSSCCDRSQRHGPSSSRRGQPWSSPSVAMPAFLQPSPRGCSAPNRGGQLRPRAGAGQPCQRSVRDCLCCGVRGFEAAARPPHRGPGPARAGDARSPNRPRSPHAIGSGLPRSDSSLPCSAGRWVRRCSTTLCREWWRFSAIVRDIAVRHVVGDRFLADAAAERSGEQGIMYSVIGYEDQMVQVYAAADVMVTRRAPAPSPS